MVDVFICQKYKDLVAMCNCLIVALPYKVQDWTKIRLFVVTHAKLQLVHKARNKFGQVRCFL